MRQTRYLYDEPIVPKRARGYAVGAKGIQNARTMSMTLPHAAGGLGSTVGDLVTWTRALRNGQAVSPQSYAAMIAPARLNDGSLSDYGFGLFGSKFRDRSAITHLGGINGFATMMTHFPEDDLTVVVLSNLESFPVERAHLALARRALDLPDLPARPRISVGADDLARCAGLYELEASPWPIAIALADGVLTAPSLAPHSRFEPFAQTEFQCVDDSELTLRFEQLGEAGYERVTVQGPMGRATIANRATTPS
jgi:CubicO group peptidase (beta-lactamase class C family)